MLEILKELKKEIEDYKSLYYFFNDFYPSILFLRKKSFGHIRQEIKIQDLTFNDYINYVYKNK